MKRCAAVPLILAFTYFLLGGGSVAMAQSEVMLQPESELRIEGTSTVNSFTCTADRMEGQARLDTSEAESRSSQATAEMKVPVQRFDCGKERMNRDLQEALKASAHPHIRYRLEQAELVEETSDTFELRVHGRLTIAGAERPVILQVQATRLSDGRYRAWGSRTLSMQTFGIKPPTAFRGLIRARDHIVVHFDLIAGTSATAASD